MGKIVSNSYVELEAQVEHRLVMIIQNEIARFIILNEQRHIDQDVYQAYDKVRGGYNPSPEGSDYERTYELKWNINKNPHAKGTVVSNDSHDANILTGIETGIGYDWQNSLIFQMEMPRPFFENFTTELSSGYYYESIRKLLQGRGGLNIV